MNKPQIAITIGKNHYQRMMTKEAWERLYDFAHVLEHEGGEPATAEELKQLLSSADACITSWGVAPLDEEVLSNAPKLKAMAHMGGSVKRYLSEEAWRRDLHVTTAAPMLAIDVAETTLGLMIVGAKKVWQLAHHVREGGWRETDAWPAGELFSKKIGIVGASNVGTHVIKLLANFSVEILLYDPFISEEDAEKMGVQKRSLVNLAEEADIISLHAPAKEDTYQLINADIISLMKNEAILINTARGSLIDETALISELKKGRLFAFLDVTDPEPPAEDSPLRSLSNVVVLPHIAGCIANCGRMSELAVEELHRFFTGKEPIYRITKDMLDRIS